MFVGELSRENLLTKETTISQTAFHEIWVKAEVAGEEWCETEFLGVLNECYILSSIPAHVDKTWEAIVYIFVSRAV